MPSVIQLSVLPCTLCLQSTSSLSPHCQHFDSGFHDLSPGPGPLTDQVLPLLSHSPHQSQMMSLKHTHTPLSLLTRNPSQSSGVLSGKFKLRDLGSTGPVGWAPALPCPSPSGPATGTSACFSGCLFAPFQGPSHFPLWAHSAPLIRSQNKYSSSWKSSLMLPVWVRCPMLCIHGTPISKCLLISLCNPFG